MPISVTTWAVEKHGFTRRVAVTRAAWQRAVNVGDERSERLDDLLARLRDALVAAEGSGAPPPGAVRFRTTLAADCASGSGPFELEADTDGPGLLVRLVGEDARQTGRGAPTASLLVLYASDVESSVRFYGMLGAWFARERHDDGPEHWSTSLGALTLELYPKGEGPATRVRLSVRVGDLEGAVGALRAASFPVGRGGWPGSPERAAVAVDPDGNHVEIWQGDDETEGH